MEFEREEGGVPDAVIFGLGAVGGFALGVLLSGRVSAAPVRELGERVGSGVRGLGGGLRDRTSGLRDRAGDLRDQASGLRDRARGVAARLSPARLRREVAERSALSTLEDAVLDAFVADEVLSARGIDVGAISRGIIELSGAVWTEDEAARAVRVAQAVPGVESVVNRMDVEDELQRMRRRNEEVESDAEETTEWTGRNIGMGRRRQGRETDPARPDDSQHQKGMAMEQADRAQFVGDEDVHSRPRNAARPEDDRPGNRPNFREDQLDNQNPLGADGLGKHGTVPNLEQPQELNSDARVGESPKPGVEMALESADVPVKPHGKKNKEDRGI